mmetsp:Transcript_61807/g.162363  ORF Transcript_61807/g.162363 Transcript_61807/m.162363 type:complete len:230 (-) Transcript_61807:1202-1891(-)
MLPRSQGKRRVSRPGFDTRLAGNQPHTDASPLLALLERRRAAAPRERLARRPRASRRPRRGLALDLDLEKPVEHDRELLRVTPLARLWRRGALARRLLLPVGLVEVGEELVVVDLPVAGGVRLADELLDVGALEGVADDDAQVLHRDKAALVLVEPFEGLPDDGLVDLDAALQGGGEELAVGDLVVVVGVEAAEQGLGLHAVDEEALLHELLHLGVRDGALVLLVHGEE